MPKYSVARTKTFDHQVKTLKKRGADMGLLYEVVALLAGGERLPERYRDHPLKGGRAECRDCHIKGDWVLVYKLDRGNLLLLLVETGSHSDLFE
jgi:mRNA interferase YafQ